MKLKLPIFLFSIAVTLFFDTACILLEDLRNLYTFYFGKDFKFFFHFGTEVTNLGSVILYYKTPSFNKAVFFFLKLVNVFSLQ